MTPELKHEAAARQQIDTEQSTVDQPITDQDQPAAAAVQPLASQIPLKELYNLVSSMLPAELQMMIWREATGLVGLETKPRPLCELNCQTNAISYKKDGRKPLRIVPVDSGGMGRIFWFKFRDFLNEIKTQVIFEFCSPAAMPRFFQAVRQFFQKPEDIPAIRVGLVLFSSCDFEDLSTWTLRHMSHRYNNSASRHVQDWIHAAQAIPTNVKVEIIVNRPMMDYRDLRDLSSRLRLGWGRVEVRINEPAWREIPDRDFHIGLTVGALQGMTMARQSSISESEAKILFDHGCRGFRG